MRSVPHILATLGVVCASGAAHAHSEQHLSSGQTVRWHRSAVTFVVDPTMFDRGTLRDPMRLVAQSASAWQGNGHVPRFEVRAGDLGEPGYDPERADNTSGIALYKHNFPQRFDRAVLALTLLTRNSVTGEIVDADVIVDAERNRFAELAGPGLVGLPGAPNDYQNVITHEFGHVLGLVEDPDHPDSTMYPSSQPGEVTKRELAAVDRESAARAYAAPPTFVEEFVGGCGGARVTPRLGGYGALGLTAIALFAIAATRRRRAPVTVFVGAALLLAAGAPAPVAQRPVWGVVERAQALTVRGVIVTRARVRTAEGVRSIERVGGRVGALEQRVLDAPSGTELRVGAVVDVGDLR
jgi:hypothetical protein